MKLPIYYGKGNKMSDSNSNLTSTAPVAATESQASESQVDLMSMTGEQAKAYVAAQKAKEQTAKGNPVKDAAQQAQGKRLSSTDPIKQAVEEAKRKLKVDNQEIDEDEVISTYKARKEHQRAANAELQRGLAARKQAEEFVSMMRDPQKFYETAKKLGHDPRQLAEEYLASQLEDELMDPRDKELKNAKAKLKQIEDLERQQKDAVERQRNEVLKAKFAKDYSDQFVAALQDSGLPPTKPMVAEMAKYISRSAELGFKMTAQEASQLVKEDVAEAHRRLIGDSDGETLLKLLGDEVANKIRKYDTSKLKNPEAALRTPLDQPEPRKRNKDDGKRMSPREWREFNRKK